MLLDIVVNVLTLGGAIFIGSVAFDYWRTNRR